MSLIRRVTFKSGTIQSLEFIIERHTPHAALVVFTQVLVKLTGLKFANAFGVRDRPMFDDPMKVATDKRFVVLTECDALNIVCVPFQLRDRTAI